MLRSYQWFEVLGLLLVFMSTAAQIFYLEPLKREIDWRLVTFYQQQNSQGFAKGRHCRCLKTSIRLAMNRQNLGPS